MLHVYFPKLVVCLGCIIGCLSILPYLVAVHCCCTLLLYIVVVMNIVVVMYIVAVHCYCYANV